MKTTLHQAAARFPGLGRCATLLVLAAGFSLSACGQTLQLVSGLDGSQVAPAGGGGDSLAPVVSPDGRYVLFASTANNLCLATNNAPLPAHFPAPLNVFLRDRSNATTVLVSVNLSGVAGGNGDSLPVDLSTDGRYAVFESSASDLAPGDTNNATDVFVRDLVSGTTALVSAATNGLPGNGASRSAALTPDGRYVAFVSAANNLAAEDTNGIADIFVRDLQADSTVLASVGAASTATYPAGSSEAPAITPDGRYVAFYSTATNLAPGVPGGGDLYVRDLVTGATAWASVGARAAVQAALGQTAAAAYNLALSADGQVLAYEASPAGSAGLVLRFHLDTGLTEVVHTNASVAPGAYEFIRSLAMTPDGRFVAFVANTNGNSGATTCILLADALTGTTTLVSGDTNGLVPAGSTADWPALDASGRYVAFLSSAVGLVTNSLVGAYHLYLRDTQSATTQLLDADGDGAGSPLSPTAVPSLSQDGVLAVFECPDANLVANDRNRDSDVFARNVAAGVTLISARHPGLPTLTANGASLIAAGSVSADGRLVAFASEADNLTPNLLGGRNIFVRDLIAGTNLLVSIATNGWSGDGLSTDPAISPDGRYVAFTSRADNLVAGDTNQAQDVFVRDLVADSTMLVSVNTNGTGPGDGNSYAPRIGSGGRYVLFQSLANNLAPGTGAFENLFLRDRQAGRTYKLTVALGDNGLAGMTPDGRFVSYQNGAVLGWYSVCVWDAQAGRLAYSNAVPAALRGLALSADGQRIVFSEASGPNELSAVDLAAGTNWAIEPNSGVYHRNLRLSSDGRFLACVKPLTSLSPTNQVFLYDLLLRTNTLVSQSCYSAAAANGASDSPDVSADGRFVAYRSAATNIVPGDLNGLPDLFLYDAQTMTTTLLSASVLGTGSAGARPLKAVFSGDGRTLVFGSWADDLVPGDFNQSADLFAFGLGANGTVPPFRAVALPAKVASQGSWLTWPALPGRTYHVQYKCTLDEPWQDALGRVALLGGQAFFNDPETAAGQRFYRIVAQ